MNRGRRAFTLIELLVVIGIIAVLLAILLPVISRVRTSATTANVTNQMHRISAAIGNYFNDFQAYPGALANKEFATANPGSTMPIPFKITQGPYTQSEDLCMALLGGLNFNAGKTEVDFVPDQIGLGPISFNMVAVTARKNAYIENVPAELTPKEMGAYVPQKKVLDLGSPPYVNDSEVPEFMDTYSSPRPILYIRANPAATSAIAVYNSKTAGYQANSHYDAAIIQCYLDPKKDFPIPNTPGSYAFSGANLDVTKQVVKDYFTSSGGGNAKNAGSYLLLDAGPDRIFGTDDDIIVGAGGGQ